MFRICIKIQAIKVSSLIVIKFYVLLFIYRFWLIIVYFYSLFTRYLCLNNKFNRKKIEIIT